MKLIKSSVILVFCLFLCNVNTLPISQDEIVVDKMTESESHSSADASDTGKVIYSIYKYDEFGGYHYEYADTLGTTLVEDAVSLTTDGTYPPDLSITGAYEYIDENGIKREGSYVTTDPTYRPIELLEPEIPDEPSVGFAPPFQPEETYDINPNALASLIG